MFFIVLKLFEQFTLKTNATFQFKHLFIDTRRVINLMLSSDSRSYDYWTLTQNIYIDNKVIELKYAIYRYAMPAQLLLSTKTIKLTSY